MTYIKTSWKDHLVEHPGRYQLVDVSTGQVLGIFDLSEVPGTVTQEGTLMSAANFQKIEDFLEIHSVDLAPHGVFNFTPKLIRLDGKLSKVEYRIANVLRAEEILNRNADGSLASVTTINYAEDGVTIVKEFTDTLNRVDGKLDTVPRAVV